MGTTSLIISIQTSSTSGYDSNDSFYRFLAVIDVWKPILVFIRT